MHDSDALEAEYPKRKLYVRQPTSVRIDAVHYPGRKDELGDVLIPCVKLRGMWMHRAGVEVGGRMSVEMLPDGVRLRVVKPAVRMTQVVTKPAERAGVRGG